MDAAPRRGEQTAVLVAALVWLALLVFPLFALVTAASPGPVLAVVVVALGALLTAYVRAVLLIARHGPPRQCRLELAVVTLVAAVLPLLFGGEWLGATVFLAALAALNWPAPRALCGVAAATGLGVLTGLAGGAPAAQLLSVCMLTALAGMLVVVVVQQVRLGRELVRATAEAERLWLARELHDSVKQNAFVAAMELGAARTRASASDPALGMNLEAAAQAVSQVQRQLTGVIDELRPVAGELVPALRLLVADWSRRTGVPVELGIGAADGTPAEPWLSVAREGLTNIERHARASRVTISLDPAELLIRDDGVGFDVNSSGHGLRGMRERMSTCGGTVEVRSSPSGTTVLARCPR